MAKNDITIPDSKSSQFLVYEADDGKVKIDVILESETVWLNQNQIAQLFGKGRTTITEHIRNIFKEGELTENSVVRNFRTTANDGMSEIPTNHSTRHN